jgi:hypothetical protein
MSTKPPSTMMAVFIRFFFQNENNLIYDIVKSVIKMVEWVRKTQTGNILYSERGIKKSSDKSLGMWLNFLCQKQLSTLEGRIKAVQTQFGFHNRPPIYVDKDHLFLPLRGLRSNESLLLNFWAITGFNIVKKQKVEICFLEAPPLIWHSYHIFAKLSEKARAVDNFISGSL